MKRRESTVDQLEEELKKGSLKKGDESIAYAACLLKRCVMKRIHPRGVFVDPSGVNVNILQFPWKAPIATLDEYGCSIAVYLYLRFLFEAGICFLLMTVVALPFTIDAVLRNVDRDECRGLFMADAFVRSAEENLTLSRCGYDGLDIRDVLPRVTILSFPLLASTGTCEEYKQTQHNFTSAQLIPTPAFYPFERLHDDASFCFDGEGGAFAGLGSHIYFWTCLLNGFLFAAFLVRLRRMHVESLRAFSGEKGETTASRFAVMIEGLDETIYDDSTTQTPSLERRLREDLQKLGFGDDDIDQQAHGSSNPSRLAAAARPSWRPPRRLHGAQHTA